MNTPTKPRRPDGQVLVIVLFVLMIAMTLVPAMVYFTQREAIWTAKQAKSTSAFHLAEAGIEKGYLEISLSTSNWVNLMKGGSYATIANYHYDTVFTDIPGGSYTISISSGPGSQQATIMAVGIDSLNRERRGIKAIYGNATMSGNAIYASGGVDIAGKVNVEWGSIVSPHTIIPLYASNSAYTWPQLWSAGQITGLDTDPNPANCDGPNCCWWHAYQKGIPSAPMIDLDYYAGEAKKAGTAAAYNCPAGALASDCASGIADDCCYYSNTLDLAGSNIGPGATVYVNTNATVGSAHGGAYINGALIVMGNFSASNGNFGAGTVTMSMPTDAWKQYCQSTAWTHYTANFDSGAPATFPGLNSASYNSPSSCTPTACSSKQIFSNGLFYVGGYMSASGGGGGTDFYGVLYVVGNDTQTANSASSTFYYNKTAADGIQLTQITLSRQSWQDFNP